MSLVTSPTGLDPGGPHNKQGPGGGGAVMWLHRVNKCVPAGGVLYQQVWGALGRSRPRHTDAETLVEAHSHVHTLRSIRAHTHARAHSTRTQHAHTAHCTHTHSTHTHTHIAHTHTHSTHSYHNTKLPHHAESTWRSRGNTRVRPELSPSSLPRLPQGRQNEAIVVCSVPRFPHSIHPVPPLFHPIRLYSRIG